MLFNSLKLNILFEAVLDLTLCPAFTELIYAHNNVIVVLFTHIY